MLPFDVPRCSRSCAVTHREISPGEWYYSLLFAENGEFRRLDYSLDGWTGLPQPDTEIGRDLIGYWKSRLPKANENKPTLAPNDVLLNLFDRMSDALDSPEMRYVLTLLLVRRRIFRLEKEVTDSHSGQKTMIVYCPKREATYRIPVNAPQDDQVDPLQETLATLIW